MVRITASCWKSFSPKKAMSGMTWLKSLHTTVATPSKWPGREAPQKLALTPETAILLAKPSGYIASTVGAHSSEQPSLSSIAESSASWRG